MFWIWFLLILFLAFSVGGIALFLVGRILRTRPYEVLLPGLPPAFDGFRISVISDLHDRRFGAYNRILSEKVLCTGPDLVVIAGDMHEKPHAPEPFYALLTALARQVPVTYTEGNHDLRNRTSPDYEAHLRKISACGASLLNDAHFPVERNGQLLMLYGQSWNSCKQGLQPSFDTTCPSVLVSHDPMQFDRLESLPDLMISGHVHGGVLRLPWIGPVFAPGDGAPLRKRFALRYFFPKYSRGLYRKQSHVLAVTQGLGFSVLPIRFIPPEVMVLTLRSGKK